MMTLKTYSLQQNIFEDFSQSAFPATLKTWQNDIVELPDIGTHFGYIYQGFSDLSRQNDVGTYCLHSGMYFCLPGKGIICGENSSGLVVTRLGYRGMFNLGGPIEEQGRFAYIDGGTSSLLIPPVMLGDPCLNAMYFPPHIDQTWHTHLSDRIGIVVAGIGKLETPQMVINMQPNTIFQIPANQLHKFQTDENSLTLVVFHPDSDAGFTHRNHPMLQRTMVDGLSAAELPQIQTRVSGSQQS
jgi:mannose-6-phosphate isomerase-like protein (cupin superfamily)